MKPILKKIAASYIVLEIFALCVVGAAALMSGCLESGYEGGNGVSARHRPHDISTSYAAQLSTQHVSGIEVTTTFNNVGILHVSGVDNIVTVSNHDVMKIYLSGAGNTVYIPASSAPYISQSGIDCAVKRY